MQHHLFKKSVTLPITSLLFGDGGLMESIKVNFAANIKRLMKDRGLTGEQLADSLGISSRAVYEWTRGRGLPRIDRLDAIAKALKTDFIELVRDSKIPLEHELTASFLREMAQKIGHDLVKKN